MVENYEFDEVMERTTSDEDKAEQAKINTELSNRLYEEGIQKMYGLQPSSLEDEVSSHIPAPSNAPSVSPQATPNHESLYQKIMKFFS